MTLPELAPLASRRPTGRVFSGDRKVRLGDVDPEGRLRLDALTRYTQDVSDDDTTDAGLDQEPGWVVRSTVVDELVPAELGQELTFETFCSGLGGRWAERRLTVRGTEGICYEVATLWVCIDPVSGRPHRLTDQFNSFYGEAAGDRKVSARQVNPAIEPDVDRGRCRPWQVRRADLDVYGHVNNAAYWAAVEQWADPWSGPRRTRLEYGGGLTDIDRVDILVDTVDGVLALWWLAPSEEPIVEATEAMATASVVELPGGLYPTS